MSMVTMSEKVDILFASLVEAQSEFPQIGKDAKNSFGGYKFATLQNVMNSTLPILNKHGLFVSQQPTNNDMHGIGVVTIIGHGSGQWMQHSYTMPLIENKKMNSAQEAGSVITYARRYALAAALGIVIDEDTDARPKQQNNPAPKQQPKPHSNGADTAALLPSQRKKFHAAGSALYGDEWDDKRAELVEYFTDGKSKSSNDLTYEQLGKLIDGFNEKLKERKNAQPELIAGTNGKGAY